MVNLVKSNKSNNCKMVGTDRKMEKKRFSELYQ